MRVVTIGALVAALVAPIAAAPAAAVTLGSGSAAGIVVVGQSGAVRALGVPSFADFKDTPPIVDIALTPTGEGYLTLDQRGTTRARGDALSFGTASAPGRSVRAAALALAPGGIGAYVAFEDGTVRALGAAAPVEELARFAGRLRADPVVDLALAPGTAGLWLLTRSGRIIALGGAEALADAPPSDSPATGLAAAPSGGGAWVAREDGSVVPIGDAIGDRGPRVTGAPKVTGIAPLGVGDDWILVDVEGNVERRGADPEPMPGEGGGIVAIDTLAASPGVTSAGPDAPSTTKIVAPALVLDTLGDPTGRLVVRMPGSVIGSPLPLEVGDVFATAIGPNTPDGLLRRILAVDVLDDGSVALTTEPAALADALYRGELSFSDDLADLVVPDFTPTSDDGLVEPAEVAGTESLVQYAVATVQDVDASTSAAGAVGTFAEPAPGRFTYGCGGSGTGSTLKVKPIFTFDPDLTFSADWGADGEWHLAVGVALQGELGVTITATDAVVCEASFALVSDLSLGKRLVFVGPVPVVVEPTVNVGAKVGGKASGSITVTGTAVGTVAGLLTVDREPGMDFVWDTTAPGGALNGDGTLQAAAKLEASFALSASVGFLLYGVVAPTVSLGSGITATYDPCVSPNFKVAEPVTLGVNLRPSTWFGQMLKPLSDVIDFETSHVFVLPGSPYPLYTADVPGLPCGSVTDLPDGRVNDPYSTVVPLTLPSGATDPVYAVEAGSALPPGLSLTTGATLEGTPTQSGVFTFDIGATHSLGRTVGSFRMTVAEAEALAITTTELPGATIDEPYAFTLQANRPAAELVWTLTGGDLPEGIALAPDGTLSGTPSVAGNYPITIQASHPASGQTAKALFNLPVSEDVGGTSIGSTWGYAVADVGPDGSAVAILFDEPVEDEDGWLIASTWRLVGHGPDGARNFEVTLPNTCTIDPICISGFNGAKAAVGAMPDGGAAVALVLDDGGVLARYGPTGVPLWSVPLATSERAQITGFEVATDGRIAVATVPVNEFPNAIDCGNDRVGRWSGADLVIADAAGDVLTELQYAPALTCADVDAGSWELQTTITGIAVDDAGTFVAVGTREWSGSRPAESFRFTEGVGIADVTAPGPLQSVGASGDRLFVAVRGQPTSCGIAIGELVGTVVNAVGPSTICASGAYLATLTGRAGVANSLIVRWDLGAQLERYSDAGASLGARSLPDQRQALAITVGSGGQLFAVEQEWGQRVDGYSPIVRQVLNPDLSDQPL